MPADRCQWQDENLISSVFGISDEFVSVLEFTLLRP